MGEREEDRRTFGESVGLVLRVLLFIFFLYGAGRVRGFSLFLGLEVFFFRGCGFFGRGFFFCRSFYLLYLFFGFDAVF